MAKTANREVQKLLRLAEKEAREREVLEKTRKEIAGKLRDLRGNISLDEVGEALGMDPSTISVIERGKTFKVSTIQRLIAFLADETAKKGAGAAV